MQNGDMTMSISAEQERDCAISDENLRRLDRETLNLSQKRYAHLLEKLRTVRRTEEDGSQLDFASFLASVHHAAQRTEATDTETESALFANDILRAEKLCFYREAVRLWEQDKQDGSFLSTVFQYLDGDMKTEPQRLTTGGHAPRIAHVASIFSNAALSAMKDYTAGAERLQYHDFQSICEAVFYDRADGCLLPLESSRDGKLQGLYTLLEEYGLKIAAACRVSIRKDDTRHKLVLLKQGSVIPQISDGTILECSVRQSVTYGISEILTTARDCGFTIGRVDSFRTDYDSDRCSYNLELGAENANLAVFLCCMLAEVSQFRLLGLYPVFDTEVAG